MLHEMPAEQQRALARPVGRTRIKSKMRWRGPYPTRRGGLSRLINERARWCDLVQGRWPRAHQGRSPRGIVAARISGSACPRAAHDVAASYSARPHYMRSPRAMNAMAGSMKWATADEVI